MKLHYDRLAQGLSQHGFLRGYPTRNVASASFVRQSTVPHVYESVSFGAAGRNGEAVFAEIGTSLTKTVAYKRIGEARVLVEVASDEGRGWTVITSSTAVREWEDAVLSIAPRACKAWATEVGARIWQRNQETWARLDPYRKLGLCGTSLTDICTSLEAAMDDHETARAQAIFANGGSGVSGTEIAHKIACMILAVQIKKIEPERIDLQTDSPLTNAELMDRIFLLADSFVRIPFVAP